MYSATIQRSEVVCTFTPGAFAKKHNRSKATAIWQHHVREGDPKK